jgi:hypothetical protein
MNRTATGNSALYPLIICGVMFALVSLLIDLQKLGRSSPVANRHEVCQGIVNSEVVVSRQQLARLLTVPEREPKNRIREILQAPYCQLPSLQVRAGIDAEREVYPLEFDPATRLVILYEGNEYAGYRFSFE